MDQMLIASLVFILGAAMWINWQRHRQDFRGTLYFSEDAAREFGRYGVDHAYQKAQVLALHGVNGRMFYWVAFPDGTITEIGEGWLLTPEELPTALF